MVKSENEQKRRVNQRTWILIGAVIVLLLGIGFVPRNSPVTSFIHRIKTCYCSQTVDRINEELLNPLLQQIVKYPFFRYFKVKLWCDCPFWPDDGMCRLRDCSVCECPENEFPETFRKASGSVLSSDDLVCQEGKPEATVDRTIDDKAFKGWMEVDNPWTNDDETDNAEMTYVNLQLILNATLGTVVPLLEEYGMLFTWRIARSWGQNLSLLYDRVLKYPDRVRNLYFTFLFVLRSVTKAADYLGQADYDTDNPVEDLNTQLLMKKLLYDHKLQTACPKPFDEAKLWKGQSGPELMKQTQRQFRNISAVMDCVGCEKCRLWGKLQILGLGTALKILFSENGQDQSGQRLQLQRNEVIALVNLLNRLSESVKFVHEMGPSAERMFGKIIGGPTDQISHQF
ncbi:UNVERIFIED_CONTAM: Endoplasmic reticulum oxidoreductin-2 [Sesamum calycinum]|uniref:Endoplasmic reticulum oxidoreductin-2 n=1 Tax=Sesamum calycinum TaxID=2727403 RepID=A0AAW2MCZ3_9LAMI